jgi:hypothetical protein
MDEVQSIYKRVQIAVKMIAAMIWTSGRNIQGPVELKIPEDNGSVHW